MRKLLFIGLVSLFFTACTINRTVDPPANTPAANGSGANTSNSGANNAKPSENKEKSEKKEETKPANNSPKRISFGKGQSNAAENMTLAPGESKKFVIGAKAGQILVIDSSAKEATVSMLTKGKTTAVTEEDGYYDSTLTGDGDFIFEISNLTKKEFKTSVNVIISGGE